MRKVVYLVGHGRVEPKGSIQLPAGVTMHWLAPQGDVTKGISHAFMQGKLNDELPSSPPGSPINEHWLCADASNINGAKIKSLFDRNTTNPLGDPNPLLLYPAKNYNLKLSAILAFLKQNLGPRVDWHCYWTCCRGFIEVHNAYSQEWDANMGKVKRVERLNPPQSEDPRTQLGHVPIESKIDFDHVRIVARSDVISINEEIEARVPKGKLGKFASRTAPDVVIEDWLDVDEDGFQVNRKKVSMEF